MQYVDREIDRSFIRRSKFVTFTDLILSILTKERVQEKVLGD